MSSSGGSRASPFTAGGGGNSFFNGSSLSTARPVSGSYSTSGNLSPTSSWSVLGFELEQNTTLDSLQSWVWMNGVETESSGLNLIKCIGGGGEYIKRLKL